MSANKWKIPSTPWTHILLVGALPGVRMTQKMGSVGVKAVTTGRGSPSHQHDVSFFLSLFMRQLTPLLLPEVKEAETLYFLEVMQRLHSEPSCRRDYTRTESSHSISPVQAHCWAPGVLLGLTHGLEDVPRPQTRWPSTCCQDKYNVFPVCHSHSLDGSYVEICFIQEQVQNYFRNTHCFSRKNSQKPSAFFQSFYWSKRKKYTYILHLRFRKINTDDKINNIVTMII